MASNSFVQQFINHNSNHEEILSLPKEKGWLTQDMYNYKGFWLESLILQGTLTSQQHFQAQDSDIILCTLPKCGTTWLKALIFALITRKHFLVSQETHPLLTKNPNDLIPRIEYSYARENNPNFPSFSLNSELTLVENEPEKCDDRSLELKIQKTPDANDQFCTGVRILATHLPYALLPKSVWESNCKMIYVCRNPKDALVSFWHFINKLRGEVEGLGAIAFPEAFDKYCKGESYHGPFWDHVLGYWKESLENPRKVLFLKYEEIKEEPGVQLRRMAEFLGCPFSKEEEERGVVSGILRLCSFERLSNLEVNKSGKSLNGISNDVFFRKGEIGDWRNHLSDEMASKVDQIVEEKFKGIGLKL